MRGVEGRKWTKERLEFGWTALYCYSVITVGTGCLPFFNVGRNSGRGRIKRRFDYSLATLYKRGSQDHVLLSELRPARPSRPSLRLRRLRLSRQLPQHKVLEPAVAAHGQDQSQDGEVTECPDVRNEKAHKALQKMAE